MAQLGTCGNCGRPLVEGRAFCGGCGTEVPQAVAAVGAVGPAPAPKEPTIRLGSLPTLSDCASCGARIEAGSLFCPACGAPPNGRTSPATIHVAPPVPAAPVPAAAPRPSAPAAPVAPPSRPPRVEGAGTGRPGIRARWVLAAVAGLVVIAAVGLVMWAGLLPGPFGGDPPEAAKSAPVPSALDDPAIPADVDIAAMIVPADELARPAGAVGEWVRVGEFRRTFEEAKPYDRCTGTASPGDARRVTHEYRLADTPTFVTEAVTVFGDAAAAARFFDGEAKAVPGCNQGNGAEQPAAVAGTDAAVVSTSATASVVRLRKGNVLVTITADETVPWQPVAEKAAARL